MTILRLLICFFLLFPKSALFAQAVITLASGTKDFPERNVYISKVIDERKIKGLIGKIYTGPFNIEKNAVFTSTLEETVSGFFNNYFPARPGQIPVVLLVNEFWIEEETGAFKEKGWAKVIFKLAEEDSSGLKIIYNYENRIEESALDVSLGHEGRIRSLLKNCLVSYSKEGKNTRDTTIYKPTGKDTLHPLTWFKNLNRGCFSTFGDLYNNKPSRFSGNIVEKEDGKILLKDSSGKTIHQLYAFYDGKSLFLNSSAYTHGSSKLFVPILEVGRYLFFEDILLTKTAATGAAAGFGLVGAAVAYSLAPDCGVLDIRTGTVTGLSDKHMVDLIKHDANLVRQYRTSEKTSSEKRKIIKELNLQFQ